MLGNAAAKQGLGQTTDTECLQQVSSFWRNISIRKKLIIQAIADQAFTNAKTAGDVQAMSDALVYQALERNTGSVGLQSNSCTSVQPINAEIAAIQRHQDPASANAAAANKASTLAVAQGIQSIGGDVTQALDAGTFSPGTLGDNTGAGNTCDDQNDAEGCIFTQKLLVQDFTADELKAQLASGGGAAATAASGSAAAASSNATATAATGSSAGSSADDASCEAENASTAASSSASAATSAASSAASSAGSTGGAAAAASDLGSCSSAPLITFGPGNDGRTEDSFAFDKSATDFNHGSADNIPVLTGFAVQQLTDSCKASAATVSAAQQAKTTADGLKGQAAADAWNAAFK